MRTIDNDILIGEICKLLHEGKRVKLRAKGNSMAPFIHGGEDILVIAPSFTLQRGDIVLAYIVGKGYVIHRITEIKADSITLMGDGNLYEQEECSRKDIFGRVESVIRAGKDVDLNSSAARVRAVGWHYLLPFRRLKAHITNIRIFK